MPVPEDRRYLKSHEWHKLAGDIVTVGITQFAADELTDVTYVKLPAIGAKVSADTSWGEIESVKATSDLYIGVSGTVVEANTELNNNPGVVNNDPYNGGWMIKVKIADTAQFNALLSASDYLKATGHE